MPDPFVVLGLELKPLSLGHLLYLDRFDLLPATQPDQIATAVMLCSRPVDDIPATLADPWLAWKMRVWLWRVSPFSEIDWAAKMLAFSDYLDAHTEEGPSTISLNDSAGSNSLADSGTPWLQHLKVTLQKALNYSHADVLALPYPQALWDYYAHHEIEGNLMVCDRDHRRQMREQADAQHDELIAEALRMQEGALN